MLVQHRFGDVDAVGDFRLIERVTDFAEPRHHFGTLAGEVFDLLEQTENCI